MYQNESNFFALVNVSNVEVGQHLYWSIFNYKIHGQVFIVSWLVIVALLVISFIGTKKLSRIPLK